MFYLFVCIFCFLIFDFEFIWNFQAINQKIDTEHTNEQECVINSRNEENKFVAHVSVPSQKQIEEALLLRKKQLLLQQYADSGS